MQWAVSSSVEDPDHFGKLDPVPDPYLRQSGKLDPDPHQRGKPDPDQYQSEKQNPVRINQWKTEVEDLEGHFGALEGPYLGKSEW